MKTLQELAEDAIATVNSGYYDSPESSISNPNIDRISKSLVGAIKRKSERAIVCEIKFASPSAGKIDERYDQVAHLAREMEAGGAAALSILTEPKNFSGSLANLRTAATSTALPLIMKDIVVSEQQIKVARKIGASAILLIQEIFTEGYTSLLLRDAINLAKKQGLEIIVETHSHEGLFDAAQLDCDVIGINNRDLKTFSTTIQTTIDLLGHANTGMLKGRIILSESGFENPADVSYVMSRLKQIGAPVPNAFLIGTSIMKSADVRSKVTTFAEGVRA